MILIFLLYAFFGLTFTLGKITLMYASPFYIVGTRMLISGIGIGLFIYYSKSTKYRPEKKDWPAFMQVTLFGLTVPYCLRAWGLQYVSSTKAAFLFCLMPFFTALFSYVIHKERLSFQKKMGLLVGFVGMMPTLFTGDLTEYLQGSVALFSLPELAIVAAVASFGYNFIALKNLIIKRNCPIPVANGITMFFGGILSLNIAFLAEPVWIYRSPEFVAFLLAIQIIVSNLICSNLQAYLLKTYSSTLMAFASLLAPLCASFYGWILLGETLHVQYILSLAIVLIGLTMYYYDELYKEIQTV
jgi:drug/metabolite transporter (DMT)-like permease